MVVVSGGGWGVGDITGAVRELLCEPEIERDRVPGGTQRAAARTAERRFRRSGAGARVRIHRRDAAAAGGRRRARALHRWRHLPGGEGRGHARGLLRAAGRACAVEHARDGRPEPAAARQRYDRAARARAGELRRSRPGARDDDSTPSLARELAGSRRRGRDRREARDDGCAAQTASETTAAELVLDAPQRASSRSRCGGCGWWRCSHRWCCCWGWACGRCQPTR